MKKNKKKHHKKHRNEVVPADQDVARVEPAESRDEAAGALIAALEQAGRLGVRVAVDGEGYTILHGREEERCGEANLAGVVVRRTPARRERAAVSGGARHLRPGAVAR